MTKAGGYPLEKRFWISHGLWHNIWCGLSDFDDKYGYKWDDQTAYSFAKPILDEKYNIVLRYSHGLIILNAFLDKARKYPLKMENIPQYFYVLRDKVLHDIFNDPLWFIRIMGKRIVRIFTVTTPVRLAWGTLNINLPLPVTLIIPSLAVFLYYRSWFYLKLLCFTFPLSITALFIYSLKGTTYYNCFHLINAATIILFLGKGILWLWQKQKIT